MRIVTSVAIFALASLALGCGKPAASTDSAPNTQVPIVQKAVSPITDILGKGNDAVAAAQAEVTKCQAQVDSLTGQLKTQTDQLNDLTAQKDKAIADATAKAQADVAPLQAQLDEVNKQIKALGALGSAGHPKYLAARAGFDLGGLTGAASGKLDGLKKQADSLKGQIDGIMAKAKDAGLPFADKIASAQSSVNTLTSSLGNAQGMLASAKDKLASLTGGAK